MKKIDLTVMERDALLFKALIRSVFPKPQKGQMYFTPQDSSADRCIYLTPEYYNTLFAAIKRDKELGKFSSSNAEEHWLNLINSFNSAKDVTDIDYNLLDEHDFS